MNIMNIKILLLLGIIIFCIIFCCVKENLENNTNYKKNDKIKLIGICVSYNYMDTLKNILPINLKHFDKIYIVTQKDDLETIRYCKQYKKVEIVYFDFKKGDKIFNKGGGMKKAQKIAHKKYPDHWYLIFDSDIVLPSNFKDILNKRNLNPEEMYGCERCIVTDKNNLQKCNTSTQKNIKSKVGVGYKEACMGYFQLYKKHKLYQDSEHAGHVDNIYSNQFKNNGLDMFVYHLGLPFKNWKGKMENFSINISLEDLHFNC